jgi:predicted ester cyclase
MAHARVVAARLVDAFNAHVEARISDLNHENAVFEGPGDVRLDGREAVTEYTMAWLNAFPDARITLNNEFAVGDWVAQEFTFEGTHEATLSSPSGDIPATHKRLKGRGAQIFKVAGDLVIDTRLYFDQVQLMTQLGLMPEVVAAG